MDISRSRMTLLGCPRAVVVVVICSLLAVLVGGSGESHAATAATRVEGEQLTGSWLPVPDAQATNGTAVVIKGAVYTTASMTAGSYVMSVRVRSAGARIVLGVNGVQVGSASVAAGWRTVSVPVYLDGSTFWGVMPVGGPGDNPVYVDWMSLAPGLAGYTTAGNRILDPSGRPVTFRGVNRPGLELQPRAPWMSDNDFSAMYLWGATIVRLQLGQQFWLPSSCAYDPGYVTRVDTAVQSITKRGMLALLDLHMTFSGQTCGKMTPPPMADDDSVRFWSQVASRYRSNPLVAFDLFNEPRHVSDDVWHDGGMMLAGWRAQGMQQLYDTVRATGATNLVFVGGENWAYNVDVALRRPVDGYGIVYTPHVYTPDGSGPLPATMDSVIGPVAARYPVVVTEFGTQQPTGTFNANVIAYAEAHGLGWAAFAWNEGPAPQNYALLQSFWSYAPTAAGAPVRAALWKARGWTTWGK